MQNIQTVMKNFDSINEILDFAINNEQKAVDFYVGLAARFQEKSMRETFEGFAKEEIKHKARLIQIKERGIYEVSIEKVMDLQISDYVVKVEASDQMSYADALSLAMKKEKSAFKLYTKLSEITDNAEMKKVFAGLAQEEAKHKLSFEMEYDDHILREN